MASTTYALLTAAAGTALLHTLIPDHWLPFVLVGRARRWSLNTVALVSGLAAAIHAALSILLGLLALRLGQAAVAAVGETLEHAGSWLLLAFGVSYALWGWFKGGHFHPGGELLHGHDHACSGAEGPGHPQHLHYHADGGLIEARGGWGALTLAVIVGLNPCVLVLPILFAGQTLGPAALGLVALAYALPAAALMVGLSVLGVRVGWGRRLPGVARYAESLSGLLIALLGLVWLLKGP